MAPRAAHRGVRVLVVLSVGSLLFVSLLIATGVPVPQLRAGVCRAVGAVVSLDRVVPACLGPARATIELASGRAAAHHRALRDALGHYRVATTAAPDLPAAHLARGDMAHMLGEYEEARAAFQQAAAIAPSVHTTLRLAAVYERLGQLDLAVQTLESAHAPWRQHAGVGARAAAANFVACAPGNGTNVLRLWHTCVLGAREAYALSFDASRDSVPRGAFRILLEAGQRERALTFARERGWLRQDVEYCGQHTVPIDRETSALLALLAQPDHADCAMDVAASVADEGGARLARMIVLDRIEHAQDREARRHAQDFLRYRLPGHDVPRVAEGLNAAGWRLQHVHDAPDDAIVVFQKAIDADPRFSWPYHNIGRVYMTRGDYEQARVWLERAVAVNPEHGRAVYDYAVTSANLKRWPDALGGYRRALAMNPNDARLHANVGWTLIELGQHVEADRELQAAVRLDPSLQAERAYLTSRYGPDARTGPTPVSTSTR